jgi:hypothetical protein
MIIVMVETRPVVLRLPHQKLQEACFEEFKTGNDFALLHHKFFCKRRVGMEMQNHYSLNLFCASCSLYVMGWDEVAGSRYFPFGAKKQ